MHNDLIPANNNILQSIFKDFSKIYPYYRSALYTPKALKTTENLTTLITIFNGIL
jgi:hypothetical protein